MITFNKYFNSKGLTLVEILASIVILGIILTAFFSFFSQSMIFSGKVEDKLSAVNLADKIFYEEKRDFNNELVEDRLRTDTINGKTYLSKISITQQQDEYEIGLFRIHIKVYKADENTFLTEVFDYIYSSGSNGTVGK